MNGSWQRSPTRNCCGFTVLELLVSFAMMGILASLLLPSVMYVRESARLMQCTSNLRQLGIAIHDHHNSHRQLPNSWQVAAKDREFAYGWAAQILPEIEQSSHAQSFTFESRPRNLTSLGEAAEFSLPLLICPSDITEPSFELLADVDEEEPDPALSIALPSPADSLLYLPTTNYLGVYGTVEADDFDEYGVAMGRTFGDGSVIHDRRVRFSELRRGLSNTMLVGERMMAAIPSTWLGVDLRGEDAGCRLAGSAMTAPNCFECDECEFSSRHAGGSNFLWADGHVRIVTESIDPELYRQSAKRNL